MHELLKELLPNPTFVDYQVSHTGQGADFYDTHRMLEYGRRIVQECQMQNVVTACELELDGNPFVDQIAKHFGLEV